MRHIAIILSVCAVCACDEKPDSAPKPPPEPLQIPVQGDKFLVVEQADETAFPGYKTYEVVAGEAGVKVAQTFDGFQIAANGRNWSWNVEEQSVDGSRDCSCETFPTEGCTSDTTMMVAELTQQGKEQRWRPPIYTSATGGLASWRTLSATARVRGDLLFTSVCLEVMKCGETPRPVCQSTVWSLADEAPKVVELDKLTTAPKGDLIADALANAEPRSKTHQALTAAKEAESQPVLVEVRPAFDGKVEQRWVVPGDIRSSGGWTAYTHSIMVTGEAAGPLQKFAPQPRPVSMFTGREDANFVGWSVAK